MQIKNQNIINVKYCLFFIVLLSTFNGTNVFAQDGLQGGLNLTLGLPQGDFSNNVKETGFGLSGNIGITFDKTPIMIGAEFSYLTYGDETRSVPFSLTIPDVKVDVTTANNILLGHLFLRLQLPNGPVRPYLDGLFGFNYLFTETTIESKNANNVLLENNVASNTNFDDTALSYGVGAGILIEVGHEKAESSDENDQTYFINLGVRYLLGGNAKYLTQGGVIRKDGKVTTNPIESKTDLLTISLGVTVNF